MTTFVLIAALLIVLTLALLTRPLWAKTRAGESSGEGGSIAALRQQLEQLANLHKAGALSQAQYTDAKATLERRIVDSVLSPQPAAARAQPPASKTLLLGLAGFIGVVAAAGYAALGTPQALDPAAASTAATEPAGGHAVTAAQIEAMVDKLAARLKERPEDVEGWAMLGRSYAALGRHDQAVPAFKQAVGLRPDDAVLIADLADALAVTNGRNLEGEPGRLIAQALKIDPNNLKALALAGSAAFNRKDYAGAVRHWEKMTQIAPKSEFVQQILPGIDEARKLMAGAPAAAAAPQAAQQAGPVGGLSSVSGVVTLAASLAGKAAPEDTLFVFARPAEGARMPLAILRKQVKDLPLTFTLDDSMALSPAARLSTAQRVVVGARISKRGDATPQPGDFQGVSAPVAPGAAGLKIEIAEVVAPQ